MSADGWGRSEQVKTTMPRVGENHRTRGPGVRIKPLESRRLLSVTLPADVNAVSPSTVKPTGLTDLDGTLLFVHGDGVHGSELWRSNGTGPATLATDLCQGAGGSAITGLTANGGRAYFAANALFQSTSLWSTDGTAAGTVRYPGTTGATGVARLGGTTYFFANPTNATYGWQLWRTDGSAAGTVAVKSIGQGTGSGYRPSLTAVAGGTLYFLLGGSGTSAELWKTDGTATGTVAVRTFTGSGLLPTNLTPAGGDTLCFTVGGGQLWRSDGTAAGTAVVGTVGAGGSSVAMANLTVVGGTLFFTATDPASGSEVWAADLAGTSGVRLVKDIQPGTPGSRPSGLTAFAGRLYFAASEDIATIVNPTGTELWSSDGTTDGTRPVVDLRLGILSSSPTNLSVANGRLYFSATGGAAATAGVWSSDGTAAGTAFVRPFSVATANRAGPFVASGGSVYFPAEGGTTGVEVWRTDGTAAGTAWLGDVRPETGSSAPQVIGTLNGRAYYFADDGAHGYEPWYTDGTAAGTAMLKEISPDVYGSYTQYESRGFAAGGYLYFVANDGSSGVGRYQVWRTDGTAAGTIRLAAFDYEIGSWGAVGNKVAFTTTSSFSRVANEWLYVSDGTPAGTKFVPSAGFRGIAATLDGVIYSAGTDATYGQELWRSDGTAAGTYRVTDLAAGTKSGVAAGIRNVGGALLFFGSDGVTAGSQIYRYTSAGGVMPATGALPGGAVWAVGGGLGVVGDRIFFSASAAATGRELWVSDGTAAGTGLVADLVPGSAGSSPEQITDLNGVAIFRAGPDGKEVLYRSDGTAAGTYVLQNIYPRDDYNPSSTLMVRAGDHVYVEADYDYLPAGSTPYHGLWRTDGTVAGTGLASVMDPGGYTYRGQSAALGSSLLFDGYDPMRGGELWRADADQPLLRVVRMDVVTDADGRVTGLTYTFNRPIIDAMPVSSTNWPMDLYVQNTTTKQPLGSSLPQTLREYDLAAGKVTFRFPTIADGRLTPGSYRAYLPAGSVLDPAGDPLANSTAFDFVAPPLPPAAVAATAIDGGSAQRSRVALLTVTFDRSVVPEAGAFAVFGRAGAAPASVAGFANPSGDGRTWVVALAGPAAGGGLGDGRYDLTVVGAKVHTGTAAGPTMAADRTVAFHRFFADLDGDAAVGFADFNLLAAQYGKAVPAWANGDLDGDGAVGFADFNLLAARYGKSLPAAGAAVALPPTSLPATPAPSTPTPTPTPVTKTLRASSDGYVRDGTYAGTNFGSVADLQVRKSSYAGQTRWGLLTFDLTSLTTVRSATLRLYGKLDSTANPSLAVQVFAAANAPWAETGVTWSNKPAVSGPALGTITVTGTTAKYYTLDLTAYLKAQKAAGKTSVALVLRAGAFSTVAATVASDEASTNRPELVVKA